MKRLLYCCLLLLPALILSDPSFAQTGKRKTPPKKTGARSSLVFKNKLMVNAKEDKSSFRAEWIKSLVRAQDACAKSSSGKCCGTAAGTTKDCTTGYCADDSCLRKIACCHELSKDTFEKIIAGSGWYANFQYATVLDLKNTGKCERDMFKFSTDSDYFYIEVVDPDSVSTVAPVSYYSMGLIMGILKKRFSYITVYTGVDLGGKEIIPFAVHVGTKTYYYDLSDTAP